MQFWKEHAVLRVSLIAALFIGGMILLLSGWKMTGKLAGLGWMLLGIVSLLGALAIYNKPFEEPKMK